MNEEQQRIALAEWTGWIITHWKTNPFDVIAKDKEGYEYYLKQLPNYPEDLNACHEVEQKLTDEQETIYYNALVDICCRYPGNNTYSATAAQRTEALCRALFPERFE